MVPSNSQPKAIALVFMLMFSVGISADTLTIPDELSRAGVSLLHTVGDESGLPPTMTQILDETDTVVKGKVGTPRSYLSDDQREIYTDYAISNPEFLYESDVATSTRPGAVATTRRKILFAGLIRSAPKE